MKNTNFSAHNILYFSRSILMPFMGLMLIVSLMSCGRRGDPFLVSPVDGSFIENGTEEAGQSASEPDVIDAEKDKAASEEQTVSRPDAPKGLHAAYTEGTVVLTWDEIIGQGVIMYRIYRMEGETYKVVGESATPAYTDKSIEGNRTYTYRISAIGLSESSESKEIIVVTEKH